MKILKRDGRHEQLSFDKVIYRLRKLCNDESLGVLSSIDPDVVAQRVVNSIYDGVSSSELDEEAARIAVSFTENPEFGKLASRIVVSNLHKSTHECFSEVMEILYNNKDSHGTHSPLIAHDVIEIVRKNKNRLNFVLDYKRDYMFDYFGFKTLERSYLLKMKNGETQKVIERPQHMYMRVALGIHKDDIENAIKTYDLISQGYYTHATPTMFNSGTPLSQLSSCFEENTIVATVNKGPIKIKDVQLGDLVVTHNGNIKPVVQLHKNPLNNRTLYEINIAKTEKIKVTDNHKLWVIPKGNNSPRWVDVETLNAGDYVGIPNKKSVGQKYFIDLVDFKDHMTGIKNRQSHYEFSYDDDVVRLKTIWSHSNLNNHSEITCSRAHSEVKRFWKITEDFAKFIGIYYGDGYIMSKKDNNGDGCIRGVGITIHKDNTKLRDFCAKVGQSVFGVKVSYHTMKSQNIIQVLFNSPIVGEVFAHYFGRGFNGKKIWNQMYQWDKNLVRELLHGIISTDDCVSKEGSVSIQMSNVSFMRDLYYLVRNVGIDISYGNKRIQKNATQHHVQMNIPRNEIDLSKIDKIYKDDRMVTLYDKHSKARNQHASKVVDGFKFIKFVSKTKIIDNLPEYVYTLGVEDDHSYNVGGIIAENCFLLGTHDSVDGIFKTMTDCARISKLAGGIGIHISNIRSKGSVIRGSNGQSDGIAPMLKVYNDIASYINQAGRRKGSFAMYIEPWHADIFDFLEMRKNQGHEDLRARDLFYALWIPDLFMKQVKENGEWHLMCPDECPGLPDVYGKEFEDLYNKYVEEKRFKKVVKAQDLWTRILEAQIETGQPYMTYKDSVNEKSNQKNIGTIRSSNLCNEICLYSDDKEYAVCNLESVALPMFVKRDENGKPSFDHQHLYEITKSTILSMNRVIDNNYYPTEETKRSNFKHRPLGIGVQGLHDVYIMMKHPFESEEARQLNREIFETIYFACLEGSMELAKTDGPYETFQGSPMSQGLLQFDLWAQREKLDLSKYLSGRWDWDRLKEDIKKFGVRNSMLTCCQPTASTAQILGNTECIEPVDSCIFKRRVLSGEFTVINRHLVRDLQELGIWSKEMKDKIILNNGSIQTIEEIPSHIRELYKTVWEISQKALIDQSADRGLFIDQTQSLNLFVANPTFKKLTSMHFYAHSKGVKTGLYYLRSKGAATAAKFSVDASLEKQIREKQVKGGELTKEEETLLCSIDNKEACMMCQ